MPFQAISEAVGLPVDQVRYIVLLLLSYPLALFLRHGLHPRHTPLAARHGFSLTAGVVMGLLCFGWQMLIILGVIAVSYFLLLYTPHQAVQRYTMLWAMGSLSVSHIYRMVTDYEGYSLDFTGPLMVLVQKVTLVAFSLHDGLRRKYLYEEQEKEKISEPPSLLEYLSYTLTFQTFLTGPAMPLCDYRAHVDGSNMAPKPQGKGSGAKRTQEPSALFPVLSRLSLCLVALTAYVVFSEYTIPGLLDPKSHGNLLSLTLVTYIASVRARSGFYFIWLLADGVNNASGLGFRGYDEDGRPLWDLATIIDPLDIELALNPRCLINGWNRPVSQWLKRVCYCRVRWQPVFISFALSAMWHGFYPSYYLSWIYLAFLIEAGRKMRRWLRHHFQGSRTAARGYDIITCITTHIFMGFGVPAFEMYRVQNVLLFWSYYYYLPLITVIAIALFLPSGREHTRRHKHTSNTTEENGGLLTGEKTEFLNEARKITKQGYKED